MRSPSSLLRTEFAFRDAVLTARSVVAVVGGTLLLASVSVQASYGNMNTYVISYLRSLDPSVTYSDWIYIAESTSIAGGICAPLGGIVAAKIGVRRCFVLGSLVQGGGYILTYWALDLGLWPCVFSIAICHAIGYGLIYAPAIGATMKWFPVRVRGFFASIAIAGYGFGSVIWVPLETAFVNPDNVEVQEVDGDDDLYFLDEALLSRVPMMFVIIGATCLAMEALGIAMLRDPDEEEAGFIAAQESESSNEKEDEQLSLKPMQAMRNLNFWLLYTAYFVLALIFSFVGNYQKAFGQNYVQDDRYFANVATVQNVANGLSRIVCGLVYDLFGFHTTVFVMMSACTSITLSFCDLALFEPNSTGARAFYAAWTIALFGFLPGCFACFAPEVARTFGSEHSARNLGIILTSTVAESFLLILLTETLFDVIGYGGVFIICGVFGMIGMLVCFLYPRESPSTRKRR